MLKGDDISTAVTALCMWEWFIGLEKDADVGKFHGGHEFGYDGEEEAPEAYTAFEETRRMFGTGYLREYFIKHAPDVDKAWELFSRIHEGVWAFDWDFVPWFMENCVEIGEEGYATIKEDFILITAAEAGRQKRLEVSDLKTFTVCIEVCIGEHVVDTVQAVDASEAELKAPKEFAKKHAASFDMNVGDFYDECSVLFVAEGEVKFDIWN